LNGSWGEAALTTEELSKTHNDLQWILSFPIANPDNGRVIGVMTIDGLTDPPISAGINESTTIQNLIHELEYAHVPAMAWQLCNLETGGF
jgi:hypothetical protein